MTRPYGGEVEFVMQKQLRLPVTIQLDKEAPHKIFTFFTHDFVKEDENLAEIQKDIKNLEGTFAYSLTKLAPAAPKVIWNQNGDLAMPVGSTFKLLILATLVDD